MSTRIVAEIGRARDAVADEVTDMFLARHPDWIDRYGDRAKAHGVQDARHHVDFLQAAVELNDPATFRDYALWCRDVLGARGIGVSFLVENLEAIRDRMTDRLSPPAADAVSIAASAGIEALRVGSRSTRAEGDLISPACRLYLAAAVTGRRADALGIVREAIRGGESPLDVSIDIFQQALYEVGRLWQSTGLTIAEEHMATSTTQYILSVLHEEHSRTGAHGGTAVVTGVANEQHVVGASIIANVLDADGWDVRFMGTNLPHDVIVSAITQHSADLVAISATMSGSVAEARDLISLIRQSSPTPPRTIVGGAAFTRDPNMWQRVGADGFAVDARHVVEVARG